MTTMTAVVMYAPGDVRLETVEKPVPGRGSTPSRTLSGR